MRTNTQARLFPPKQRIHKESAHSPWQHGVYAGRGALLTAIVLEARREAYKNRPWTLAGHSVDKFRDPYGSYNLLDKFDLSWHQDVQHHLANSQGEMRHRDARRFIRLLRERELIFLGQLQYRVNKHSRRYFERQYEKLRGFLKQATTSHHIVLCDI